MRKIRKGVRRRTAPTSSQSIPATVLLQALPLCTVLTPIGKAELDSAGVVLVRQLVVLRPGRFAFSILAHDLPTPNLLGSFNAYQGLVYVPNVIAWGFTLFPTPETPVTWSGSFTESTLNPLPNGLVQVRPYNTDTGATGAAILQGRLQ